MKKGNKNNNFLIIMVSFGVIALANFWFSKNDSFLKEVEDKKEIKIYTVEDIDPKLLVSKSGKKLTGNARQVKIEKILSELNKRGIK